MTTGSCRSHAAGQACEPGRLFAGLGLLVTGQGGGNLGPVGLIPGFIGLGYLASYALSQRLSSRKNETSQ